MVELILKEPLFLGRSEGDQLFAIFKILGSPSQEEYEKFSKRVPFDPSIFKKFPEYKTKKNWNNSFEGISDKKNLIDLLNKIFQYLPENRISAFEAMNHPFFEGIYKKIRSFD